MFTLVSNLYFFSLPKRFGRPSKEGQHATLPFQDETQVLVRLTPCITAHPTIPGTEYLTYQTFDTTYGQPSEVQHNLGAQCSYP